MNNNVGRAKKCDVLLDLRARDASTGILRIIDDALLFTQDMSDNDLTRGEDDNEPGKEVVRHECRRRCRCPAPCPFWADLAPHTAKDERHEEEDEEGHL
jgi:hypothetical protein